MKTADLHTHSIYSDGTLSPQALVRLAAEKGLSALALTDHDTLDGTDEALYWGERLGVEVIRGVEISTDFENNELHIVGLFTDNSAELSSALSELRNSREQRNMLMVEKLNSMGMDISYDDVVGSAGGAVVTRAHIAREIIKKGYASSNNEAFERYIGKDKPAYVRRSLMDYRTTLRLIAQSGGISVLAHPFTYKLSERRLEKIVDGLKDCGLSAIEAYYSTHSASETEYIKELAVRKGLKISGGSDFHGENKPGLELGTGYGKLEIPYSILEGLKSELKKER